VVLVVRETSLIAIELPVGCRIDGNAQIDCTIVSVTYNIGIAHGARLHGQQFRKHLIMLGRREERLTSDELVVHGLGGRRRPRPEPG
jgi:hypothetical protein